jgi:AcrR family transcriptional regulator
LEESAVHRSLHDQILEAALNLFITYGYHGLSMRQIAEAVGVSKAALYYHFQDKEQLFLAVLDAQLEHFGALIDAAAAEEQSARQRIRRLVTEILSQPIAMRAAIRLASQEMAQLNEPARATFNQSYHARFIDKIQALLEAGIDQGELRPVDAGVATWALLGILYPYFFPSQPDEVPLARDVIEPVTKIFLDGIALPQD